MTFKDDFDAYLRDKVNKSFQGRSLVPRDCFNRVHRYICPRSKAKPNLFDPEKKSGPVRTYTREEIEEYERNLKN